MAEYTKPLPVPVHEDKEFWAGAKRHELLLKKCSSCGTFVWYCDAMCSECQNMTFIWVKASGKGNIFSYNVVYRSFTAGWEDTDAPWINVLIDLEEGSRMVGNLRDCRPQDVRIGMPVEVFFDDVTPEITLPVFRPRKG